MPCHRQTGWLTEKLGIEHPILLAPMNALAVGCAFLLGSVASFYEPRVALLLYAAVPIARVTYQYGHGGRRPA